MPYRVFGRDSTTGIEKEPVVIVADSEEQARVQAEVLFELQVERVELVSTIPQPPLVKKSTSAIDKPVGAGPKAAAPTNSRLPAGDGGAGCLLSGLCFLSLLAIGVFGGAFITTSVYRATCPKPNLERWDLELGTSQSYGAALDSWWRGYGIAENVGGGIGFLAAGMLWVLLRRHWGFRGTSPPSGPLRLDSATTGGRESQPVPGRPDRSPQQLQPNLLTEAEKMFRVGDWDQAVALFARICQEPGYEPHREYARQCLGHLRRERGEK
jgi:hypothetical protein